MLYDCINKPMLLFLINTCAQFKKPNLLVKWLVLDYSTLDVLPVFSSDNDSNQLNIEQLVSYSIAYVIVDIPKILGPFTSSLINIMSFVSCIPPCHKL